MKRNKTKRVMAFFLAALVTATSILPSNSFAAENTEDELQLYDAEVRTDLTTDEVAKADDIEITTESDFDISISLEGIQYQEDQVAVSYYDKQGSFEQSQAGSYDTYYKVEPKNGKTAYLIHRTISVKENTVETTQTPEKDDSESSDDSDDGDGQSEKISSDYPLAEGEIATAKQFMMSSAAVSLKAASSDDKMKVAYDGYAKYCGHSIGIKYVSEAGAYKNHAVFCMNMNKNTTSGTVSSGKHVKAEITFCLVNGVRTHGGRCHTAKYQGGSAAADYFITSAAIHVLNGEVSLKYFNDGSGTYKNIAQLVSDAKNYDKDEYNSENGVTKSITYSLSPARTEWTKVEDDLYRTSDKIVRTKSGTIVNVSYSITGYPSGLTVGEIKTDASDIEDASDLKKYDICVAQTDASKASSNFYVYCNAKAMTAINKANSKLKVKGKATAAENYGRVWKPTAVSEQKITFLESETVTSARDSITITSDYKTGSFELHKTDHFTHSPIAGASYYLYADADCDELVSKLASTDTNGIASTGKIVLTENKYYLKEVRGADGYQVDETIYEIPLSDFTLYDANGKETQKGAVKDVDEIPEFVGVVINKTDKESGNVLKKAGFAVFNDAACTVRTEMDDGTDVPVFYYSDDLQGAFSEKFPKFQSTFYVKEVVVPVGYVDEGRAWQISLDYGDVEVLNISNTPIRCKVNAVKHDKEKGANSSGDAKLSGATYGLYAAEDIYYPDERGSIVTYTNTDVIQSTKGTDFQMFQTPAKAGTLLATVKTDAKGQFNFGHLYYGNYYVKEIAPSEGYLLDDTVYSASFKNEPDKNHDMELNMTVIETVMKKPFEMIKISTDGSSTEMDRLQGAEFTVKLQSEIDRVGWDNAAIYDVLTTDSNGYALSVELPYGTYLVKETKTPKDVITTSDFKVVVKEDSRTPDPYGWRIMNDVPFKAYIRIIKKDADTNQNVLVVGTTFKIRNTETGEYISQKVGNKKIDIFETEENGMVTTPLMLEAGNYEMVEITAPNGYTVADAYSFVVGNDGAVKISYDDDGDPVIEVEIENKEVVGNVTIQKSGEVLVGDKKMSWIQEIIGYVTGLTAEGIDFSYENQGLEGTVYNLVADETIYTPDYQLDSDGNRNIAAYNGVPVTKGAIVATVTTDKNGTAEVKGLPLGHYHAVEVEAPDGFVLNKEIHEISLEYAGQTVPVVFDEVEVVNDRVKTDLKLVKKNANTEKLVSGATYGLYAAEDIEDVNGEVVVKQDELIEKQVTDVKGEIHFKADLPLGEYYVKELLMPPGYLLDETKYEVDFSYQGQEVSVISDTIEIDETPITVSVSKTDITTGKEIEGATLQIVDSNGNVFAEWVSDGEAHEVDAIPAGSYTLVETKAPTETGYVKAESVPFTVLEMGKIQKVEMKDDYTKVEITKTDITGENELVGAELTIINSCGEEVDSWTSEKEAHYMEYLPVGEYTLREESAPYGYKIAKEVKFTVAETGEVQKVSMKDELVKGKIIIHKTDKDTKKAIAGVEFEIRDAKGKIIETLVTDKKGNAESMLLDIATFKDGEFQKDIHYTVVETKAAKGYKLDKTKHDVVFQYDDNTTEDIAYTLNLTNEKEQQPKLPQTGDNFNPWIFLVIGLASAGVGILLAVKKRKKDQKGKKTGKQIK